MRIPGKNRIGEEGGGFIYQMKSFQHERFCALPSCYITNKKTIDETVDHLRKRVVFGKPLIDQTDFAAQAGRLAHWNRMHQTTDISYCKNEDEGYGRDTRDIDGEVIWGQIDE